MKVSTREQAWQEVSKIFPTDYEKDEAESAKAGYDIYRHPTLNYYNRICDLGNRLEVLTGQYGNTVTNIWIEEPKKSVEDRILEELALIRKELQAIRSKEFTKNFKCERVDGKVRKVPT